MSKKKVTAGQKDLLHGFNSSFGKNHPTHVFTQDKINTGKKKTKSVAKKQTSIRVNADASSMLMSIEAVMRFKNMNEVLYHLISEQYDNFSREQKAEYRAFKKVYEFKKK